MLAGEPGTDLGLLYKIKVHFDTITIGLQTSQQCMKIRCPLSSSDFEFVVSGFKIACRSEKNSISPPSAKPANNFNVVLALQVALLTLALQADVAAQMSRGGILNS